MEKQKPIRDMTREEFQAMATALLTVTDWKLLENSIYEGRQNDWIFVCGKSVEDDGTPGYVASGVNPTEKVTVDFPERIAEALFKRIGRTIDQVN